MRWTEKINKYAKKELHNFLEIGKHAIENNGNNKLHYKLRNF